MVKIPVRKSFDSSGKKVHVSKNNVWAVGNCKGERRSLSHNLKNWQDKYKEFGFDNDHFENLSSCLKFETETELLEKVNIKYSNQ